MEYMLMAWTNGVSSYIVNDADGNLICHNATNTVVEYATVADVLTVYPDAVDVTELY